MRNKFITYLKGHIWAISTVVLLCIVFIILLCPHGPAISRDTFVFFEAGDQFWASANYSALGPHGNWQFCSTYPPLYPIFLSLFRQLESTGTVLQVLLFFSTLTLFAGTLKNLKAKRLTVVIGLIGLAALIAPIYYKLWTESLFCTLIMALAYRWPNTNRALTVILLLIALSLTRVTGLVIGPSMGLVILIMNRAQWRRAAGVALASVIPVLIWAALGTILNDAPARELAWHPISLEKLGELPNSIAQYLSISNNWVISPLLGLIILVLTGLGLVVSIKRNQTSLAFLLTTFFAYLAFLIISISVIDFSTPFSPRILLPAIILLWLVTCLAQYHPNHHRRSLGLGVIMLMLCHTQWQDSAELYNNGFGFTHRAYQELPLHQHFSTQSYGGLLYSNQPHKLYYLNGKPSAELPVKIDLYRGGKNQDYKAQWDMMVERLMKEDGTLIWFRDGAIEQNYVTYEQLKAQPYWDIVYDDWACLVIRPSLP